MLTVKLMRHQTGADNQPISGGFSTRIIEASEVNVHILRPGELAEVSGTNGADSFAFYVAARGKQPKGFAEGVEFWYKAFIENSAGATTEVVGF